MYLQVPSLIGQRFTPQGMNPTLLMHPAHLTAELWLPTTGMPWRRSRIAVEQKVKGQWNCALKVPGVLDNCLLSSQVVKGPEDWVHPEDQK